ncbi:MAG: hypothetical protein PHT29_05525, partial [Eubacteriales bacterium]|nr:hypothetical protein [Eubacteriales bacterium]
KFEFAASVKEEIGWECIAVDGYNEYLLSEITSLMSSHPEKEFVGDEQVQDVRSRIAQMHDALETVLYSTSLAMQSELTPERMVEIKNTIAELEKGVLNLGSTVTQEERNGDYELPLEGELPPLEPRKKKNGKKNGKKK